MTWRTTLKKGRALLHGRPITVDRTRLRVPPTTPVAATRPADTPQGTSRATFASFFARPQTTPAAPAPQAAPTGVTSQPQHTRAEPATAASPAPATVSAVPAPPVVLQALVLALTFPDSFISSGMQTLRAFLRHPITPLLSPRLVLAWKRQKVPIVPAFGITRVVFTPLCCLGGCSKCTKSVSYTHLTLPTICSV